MKFALFTAAALALASAPTYSQITNLFNENATLISAFAPGTAALVSKDRAEKQPAVIALAN